MRLSKAQTFVITALNAVIIVLIALIFWSPFKISSSATGGNNGNDDGDNPTGGEIKQHEKLRPASAGACPEILRETRLMGNGDETVVSVYFRGGVSYIFGNATVKGLDFDVFGGFLCLVNGAGNILSFTYFDGAITSVGVVGGGYAVGAGEKLYFVDGGGKSVLCAQTDGNIVDVFVGNADKIAVITQPTRQSLRLTEYAVSDETWTAGNSTRIFTSRDLSYFDCYAFDGLYVVSARASSLPQYDALALFSFAAGGEPTAHYEGGAVENITRPFAVIPYDEGYLALVSRDGIAAIVTLDNTFSVYRSVTLGFEPDGGRLFFADGKYYACFERKEGALTYELDDKLNRVRVPEWDGLTVDRMSVIDGLTAVGERDGMAAVVPRGGRGATLDAREAVFYGGFLNSDGKTFVLSATGGSSLSKPTAGRDVYVVTVRNS